MADDVHGQDHDSPQETIMFHRIIAFLDQNRVEFELYTHGHVHSSEDAAKVRGTSLEEAAKALVLETGSGSLVQCIISGHRRLDLKRIKQLLGEKNVSLAHPEKVLSATGCPVGTVPPFGNLFHQPLPVYADADIFTRPHIVFSAGSHYRSVRMLGEDWKRLVRPQVCEMGKG